MKNKISAFLGFIFILIALTGCEKEDNNTSGNENNNTAQTVFFPATVGAKWKYEKITTNTITSENTPAEQHEYLYMELKSYNELTQQYNLTVTQYIKRILICGSYNGLTDSIVYEDNSTNFLLRNNKSKLEMSMNNGTSWTTCLDTIPGNTFRFYSPFVKTQTLNNGTSTTFGTHFINDLPSNEFGEFNCYKSNCYESELSGDIQRTNTEYYSKDIGIIESYSRLYSYTEGYFPDYESELNITAESVFLVGYKIGNKIKGADVNEIEYSVIYQY